MRNGATLLTALGPQEFAAELHSICKIFAAAAAFIQHILQLHTTKFFSVKCNCSECQTYIRYSTCRTNILNLIVFKMF